MPKKTIICIPVETGTGTAKIVSVPGLGLPRDDKTKLELTVAKHFLTALASQERAEFTQLRPNEKDPPDMLFESGGETIGIELTELLPVNELKKDSILQSLRAHLLSQIVFNSHTRDKAVRIFFLDDYEEELPRQKKMKKRLADLLNDYFTEAHQCPCSIPVPPTLQDAISAIHIEQVDLSEDPRVSAQNEPLLIFGAQNTLLIPEDDVPHLVKRSIGKKALHDLAIPTWLLMWSDHAAVHAIGDELEQGIRGYMSATTLKYDRVFYLSLSFEVRVIEFEIT